MRVHTIKTVLWLKLYMNVFIHENSGHESYVLNTVLHLSICTSSIRDGVVSKFQPCGFLLSCFFFSYESKPYLIDQ